MTLRPESTDRALRWLVRVIGAAVVALVLSSIVARVGEPTWLAIEIGTLQRFLGAVTVGLATVLAGANMWLADHPLHEYWVVVMLSAMVGVVYAL